MKKAFKIVLVNLLICIIFIIIIDTFSMFVLSSLEISKTKENDHSLILSYSWAKKNYEEWLELEWEYRSFFVWRRLAYQGETIKIDDQGIRKTAQSPNINNESKLAVFLGGSTIWGYGVPNESTIPSYFAQKTKGKFKVLNFGESGYKAYQSYVFFQIQTMQGVRPEIVISYDGVNNSPAHVKKSFSTLKESKINDALSKNESSGYVFQPKNILKPTSTLIDKIKQKLRSRKGENASGNDYSKFTKEENHAAAEELLQSWLVTKQHCDNLNLAFICVLQPNAFIGKPQTNNIRHLLAKQALNYAYYDEVLSLMTQAPYSVLSPHFVDLRYVFDETPNVYLDFCHLSPKGNAIIADAIVERLDNLNF